MKVLETKKERLDSMRFIGRRYTDEQRDENNSFNEQWQEWLENNRFEELCQNRKPLLDGKCIGFTNTLDDNSYWIGYFFDKDEFIPRGYDFFDLFTSEVLSAKIQGNCKNGEVYSLKAIEACIDKFIEQDYFSKYKISQEWFFDAHNPNESKENDDKMEIDYYFKIRKATIEDETFLQEAKNMNK